MVFPVCVKVADGVCFGFGGWKGSGCCDGFVGGWTGMWWEVSARLGEGRGLVMRIDDSADPSIG